MKIRDRLWNWGHLEGSHNKDTGLDCHMTPEEFATEYGIPTALSDEGRWRSAAFREKMRWRSVAFREEALGQAPALFLALKSTSAVASQHRKTAAAKTSIKSWTHHFGLLPW